MKTKIQAGLADRHTREFLVEHNILKGFFFLPFFFFPSFSVIIISYQFPF